MKLASLNLNSLLSLVAGALLVSGAAFAQDAGPDDAGVTDAGPVDDGGVPGLPEAWTCDASWYGDSMCDCGCGAPDADCVDPYDLYECVGLFGLSSGCAEGEHPVVEEPYLCTAPVCGDGSNAGLFLDEETTSEQCDDGNLTDGDGCSATCQLEPGYGCPGLGGDPCVEVPTEWTCNPNFYADGDCDCGCGVIDQDCGGDASTEACVYNLCEEGFEPDEDENWLCVELPPPPPPPAEWTCNPGYYAAGDGCDCGCGAIDADCGESPTLESCEFGHCDDSIALAEGEIDPDDISQCNEDQQPEPGDDAGVPPGGDDAGPGGNDGDDDAGPGNGGGNGGGDTDAGPTGDDDDDDEAGSCSASTVTASSAPLSLAVLFLLGGLVARRRRD